MFPSFSNFRQAVVREALFQLRKSKLNGEKSYSHSDKNLYARTITESSELYWGDIFSSHKKI